MQLSLFSLKTAPSPPKANGVANRLDVSDRPFHDWYRFVLSFPPHLVRDYIQQFALHPGQTLLDPFCGTGTTIVEAKKLGLHGIGIEANPMAHFASCVKVDWNLDPDALVHHAVQVAHLTREALEGPNNGTFKTLSPEAMGLLLKDSISPLPLHKALTLLEQLHLEQDSPFYRHELLAFAKTLVFSVSNLHFGPEVGVRRIKRQDGPVIESWLSEIRTIATDLRRVTSATPTMIHHADARQMDAFLSPHSIDAVFTSPPYPNEKDYTRTTRLELVLLGFICDKPALRHLKHGLLRSNTRNVYKGDADDQWVSQHHAIQTIAEAIEQRRIALGKTSGFERLYGKVTKLYFGGMARHLAGLRPFLKPGARLGYVVGDQASYLQVMIRTGQLLGEIAQSLGYEVTSIDLFRTRLATATRQQMREEVVVLRWPGAGQ